MDLDEGFWTSRSKVERLGRNLLAQTPPADEHLEQLHELLGAYDEALSYVTQKLEDSLGVSTTSRLKNTGTILEKLLRHGGSSLSKIQDLAGARVVAELDLIEQDLLVKRIEALFEAEGRKPPKIIDRRENPRQGYRAVHIVVYIGKIPVEIQVRTTLQHWWANLFEKVADAIGREIRYGEVPADRSGGILPLAARASTGHPRPLTENNAGLADWVEERLTIADRIVDVAQDMSEAVDWVERMVTISHHPAELREVMRREGAEQSAHEILEQTKEAKSKYRKIFDKYSEAIDRVIEREKRSRAIYEKIHQQLVADAKGRARTVVESLNLDLPPEKIEEIVLAFAESQVEASLQQAVADERPGG
ncbi:RelA/SpoT domain-containing protein [Actinosynnema sp. CS-041913]|uniref:RelA/SpoT domain-containing protein n=1 Tax=Actinosynnema sp. CS-041913 TaxID=3239917 RepID=UPI003D8A8A90